MNDLEQYSQDEIEDLARKYLDSQEKENQNLSLKITKIDKEYKKHNSKAVKRVIINGSVILAASVLIMNSNINVADVGNGQILDMIDQVQTFGEDILSILPGNDLAVVLYAKALGVLDYAIEQVGIVGVALASKSVSLILNSIRDTIKGRKIKSELNNLREILDSKINESERQK